MDLRVNNLTLPERSVKYTNSETTPADFNWILVDEYQTKKKKKPETKKRQLPRTAVRKSFGRFTTFSLQYRPSLS